MGPLLIWARRVVDDFADDILAAREETGKLTEQAEQAVGTWESMARLTAYLDQLLQRGAPVPARLHKGEHQVSQIYIAARWLPHEAGQQPPEFRTARGLP